MLGRCFGVEEELREVEMEDRWPRNGVELVETSSTYSSVPSMVEKLKMNLLTLPLLFSPTEQTEDL